MKDYKIKEHLLNLKQSVDSLKSKFEDMTDKFSWRRNEFAYFDGDACLSNVYFCRI